MPRTTHAHACTPDTDASACEPVSQMCLAGPADLAPRGNGAEAEELASAPAPPPSASTGTLDRMPSANELEEYASLMWAGGAGSRDLESHYGTLPEREKDGMRDYVNEVMPWHRATDRGGYTLGGERYRPLMRLDSDNRGAFELQDPHGRDELGSFAGPGGGQLAVLTGDQSVPMSVREARHHALETGSATIYDGRKTEQLQINDNSEDGFYHSVRPDSPETEEEVLAQRPGSGLAATVAEVGKQRNEFRPIEMARTGKSDDVLDYCSDQARSADSLVAAREFSKVMASYIPGTGLIPAPGTNVGSLADMAQAMMNVDEDGVNFRGPSFTTSEEVRASLPEGVYENCLREWDYTGATKPR